MGSAERFDRRAWLGAALFVCLLLGMSISASPGRLRLPDLQGTLVDPFEAPQGTQAIVFLFVRTECPMSNRYAPDVRRLHGTFALRHVVFRLVYPDPADSPKTIRDHITAYAYPMDALRDPRQALATLAKATVTPEAAVFDARGRLVYHGRIDNRYEQLGEERQVPTRRDLEEALTAVLAGRAVPQAATHAVGCFLADLLR